MATVEMPLAYKRPPTSRMSQSGRNSGVLSGLGGGRNYIQKTGSGNGRKKKVVADHLHPQRKQGRPHPAGNNHLPNHAAFKLLVWMVPPTFRAPPRTHTHTTIPVVSIRRARQVFVICRLSGFSVCLAGIWNKRCQVFRKSWLRLF